MAKQPLALIILDGWGICPEKRGNAVAQAHTPTLEQLSTTYPHSKLNASGEEVGLPQGQMGNSEVGHLNIGAGRVVYQELTRISLAIRNKDFFANPVLKEAVSKAKGRALHLIGLLSDGGVHSHIEHLYALLEMAKAEGLEQVFVHCFLDGRDVPPKNALEYINPLEQKCSALGTGKIATVMGRFYAMDRDRRWDRVEKAYKAMVYGDGLKVAKAADAVQQGYDREETDEFILPTVVTGADGQPVGLIKAEDSVIFFNFRPDRAREITRAFVDTKFDGFDRGQERPQVHFVCMTRYDQTIQAPVAYLPQSFSNTLGEVLANQHLQQLRIAETEKYAHVTFFFNGGVETPYPGEVRELVESPKIATYDLQPEMSAAGVTDKLIEHLADEKFDVIICNYANPDMVGHTGNMEAAVQAIEAVDQGLAKVVPEILKRQGTIILTADHGNAEHMKDDEGQPFTAHTSNDVPFILIGEKYQTVELKDGSLQDIAPTMLEILGITQPAEMTGQSLIVHKN